MRYKGTGTLAGQVKPLGTRKGRSCYCPDMEFAVRAINTAAQGSRHYTVCSQIRKSSCHTQGRPERLRIITIGDITMQVNSPTAPQGCIINSSCACELLGDQFIYLPFLKVGKRIADKLRRALGSPHYFRELALSCWIFSLQNTGT